MISIKALQRNSECFAMMEAEWLVGIYSRGSFVENFDKVLRDKRRGRESKIGGREQKSWSRPVANLTHQRQRVKKKSKKKNKKQQQQKQRRLELVAFSS